MEKKARRFQQKLHFSVLISQVTTETLWRPTIKFEKCTKNYARRSKMKNLVMQKSSWQKCRLNTLKVEARIVLVALGSSHGIEETLVIETEGKETNFSATIMCDEANTFSKRSLYRC